MWVLGFFLLFFVGESEMGCVLLWGFWGLGGLVFVVVLVFVVPDPKS